MEPIKISTIKQFKWCGIDSYIEHLAEIGDDRVSLIEPTQSMKKGTDLHSDDSGLRVRVRPETSKDEALERTRGDLAVATNYKNYQIIGSPDRVEKTEDEKYRVVELKTTTVENKDWFKRYEIPPASLQANLYTWMLDIRGIPVDDARVVVKKQHKPNDEWFTYECSYNRKDVEEELDFIFDKFNNPRKLEEYKPSQWKCKDKNHWNQYKEIMREESQSDSNKIYFYQWEIEQEDIAVVYSEDLEVDQEFDMSRDGKKYEMYVFRLIGDIPEEVQNDLDGDYDLGLAQALEVKSYE